MKRSGFFGLVLPFFMWGLISCAPKATITDKSMDMPVENRTDLEVATLAGGCFWCIEAIFQELNGVIKVESGFSGGHLPNPTYKQVCYENTGHAEAVQIYFDPKLISYDDLLKVFFTVHDPTTLNRQGNDVGTQYRSVVFYHNDQQKQAAESAKSDFATSLWDDPIVTEIVPFETFYTAENYHQDYYNLNPNQPYCRVIINPKVEKFRKQFAAKLKKTNE